MKKDSVNGRTGNSSKAVAQATQPGRVVELGRYKEQVMKAKKATAVGKAHPTTKRSQQAKGPKLATLSRKARLAWVKQGGHHRYVTLYTLERIKAEPRRFPAACSDFRFAIPYASVAIDLALDDVNHVTHANAAYLGLRDLYSKEIKALADDVLAFIEKLPFKWKDGRLVVAH